MIIILSYLSFEISNSEPYPVPNAVIMALISALSRALSILVFSTLRIFPLKGRIAWVFLFLPLFALPPALSPSTIKISLSLTSLLVQSASLEGIEKSLEFFLVDSFAFLAASLAVLARMHFSTIFLASLGFSMRYSLKHFVTTLSEMKSNLFVCPKCGKHEKISAVRRVRALADKGTFRKLKIDVPVIDPLKYPDYNAKIEKLQKDTGLDEGVLSGVCEIEGMRCVVAVMASEFLMGSMGIAVGEKITRSFEIAEKMKLPPASFVTVCRTSPSLSSRTKLN